MSGMRHLGAGERSMVAGLTGGIACGKTIVARELARRGARIIDADAISREVMRRGTPVYTRIVKTFGRAILGRGGAIDRKKLGNAVFADARQRKLLERITHPAIVSIIKRRVRDRRREGEGIVIVEAPLLYEAGLESSVDVVAVVWSPYRAQIERLMRRDGIDEKSAKLRVRSQMPVSEKRKRADLVIKNAGSREQLGGEIKKVWQALTNRR